VVEIRPARLTRALVLRLKCSEPIPLRVKRAA
jgi:hypothetical protein